MKIPAAEMPKLYYPLVSRSAASHGQIIVKMTALADEEAALQLAKNPYVEWKDYRKLFNERRFIPIEECSPWISVEDRLPDGSEKVLWFVPGVGVGSPPPEGFKATHWMPLPAPPEAE